MSDVAPLAPGSGAGRRPVGKAGTIAGLVKAMRDLTRAGIYQPKLDRIVAASGLSIDAPYRLFGSKRGLAQHVARRYAADVVDTLQLSDKARAALSDRDERIIAMAVLGGRRLEAGQ